MVLGPGKALKNVCGTGRHTDAQIKNMKCLPRPLCFIKYFLLNEVFGVLLLFNIDDSRKWGFGQRKYTEQKSLEAGTTVEQVCRLWAKGKR